eukprot:m.120900 g.120900  ORF g.120900 m.120900 type:complete len:1312 (+) comp16518_c0_seq3:946-4881(+)
MASVCNADVDVLQCPRCAATVRPQQGLSAGVYQGTCQACHHVFSFRSIGDAPSDPTSITFVLDGSTITLKNPDPTMTLNDYLRNEAGLTGTKRMCGQGGCGSCTVALTRKDKSGADVTVPVNSCLRPLCSMDGMAVTTVQGIGSRAKGYHEIQKALASHSGSQCGYCSPGMVMNMYSLLKDNPKPTPEQVEGHFDGNICRCTGYRPILEAMRSFATTAEDDIENIVKRPCSTLPCASLCHMVTPTSLSIVGDDGTVWRRPANLAAVFADLKTFASRAIKLVVGNTSVGVFKHDKADVLLDVSRVPELSSVTPSKSSLVVGATTTIEQLITMLRQQASVSASFTALADHLQKIANVAVRSVGSWAGNIMMTKLHDNFPSDVFTTFAALGATLTVASDATTTQTLAMFDFLTADLTGKVIVNATIPVLQKGESFSSYKIMPRHENAHAHVNAGFRFTTDASHKVSACEMVFGGIASKAVQAPQTVAFLKGKVLTDASVIQQAATVLKGELKPADVPAWAAPSYRLSLATTLLYKSILNIVPVSARVASAAGGIDRPVSSSQQTYSTDKTEYPVSEPLPKLTALQQTSGEAVYVDDCPPAAATLHGAFVLSTTANATLQALDVSAIRAAPGVAAVLTAADITGQNNVMPPEGFREQPMFVAVNSKVEYKGQAIALVLAATQKQADAAAKLSKQTYTNVQPAILTIDAAIKAGAILDAGLSPVKMGKDIDKALAESARVVTGQVECGSQYHFFMETHSCTASPKLETGGVHLQCSTQAVDFTQNSACQVLGLSQSQVQVELSRVGGAYGGKITQCLPTSSACALAAHVLGVPVRMVVDLDTTMQMHGKRHPWLAKFSIGVDAQDKLHAVKIDYYADCGMSANDSDGTMAMALTACDGAYTAPNWTVTPYLLKTNKPSNTATRAPGCCPAIFSMETAMDFCAQQLGKDPTAFRLMNLNKQGDTTPYGSILKYCNLPTMWTKFLDSTEYATRRAAVDKFNSENRWKKKGIAIAPNKYGIAWGGATYSANVVVYGLDATVLISSGGAESGQGLNTKLAQVAAKFLGAPLDKIRVNSTSTFSDPNNIPTGGSIGSELCCTAISTACANLKKRLDAVAQTMQDPTWEAVVAKAHGQGVDLAERGWVDPSQPTPFQYFSYGMVCTEVELDVLTGEHEILRVDILFDCGQSLNPAVDIGQVEGGFVMGLGYWLSEQIKYDTDGTLLTNGTWEYKPPGAKDIPIDFRVELMPDAPNPSGFLRSKASGEPPLCMAANVMFALKYAICAAKLEQSSTVTSFAIDGPATVERVQGLCGVSPGQFQV